MPRARISYEQRVIIEDMRKNGYKAKDICEAIGISSYDYQRELILGFTEDKKYSAMKAQMSLKQEAEMENEKMTAKELYEAMIEGKLEYKIDYSVLKKKKKKKRKK